MACTLLRTAISGPVSLVRTRLMNCARLSFPRGSIALPISSSSHHLDHHRFHHGRAHPFSHRHPEQTYFRTALRTSTCDEPSHPFLSPTRPTPQLNAPLSPPIRSRLTGISEHVVSATRTLPAQFEKDLSQCDEQIVVQKRP